MKRKISIIKAFAILLSICLLISSNLTVIEVFASEVNVSSTDDEATKEAKEDYNSPKLKAGNWKKALMFSQRAMSRIPLMNGAAITVQFCCLT